MRIIPAELEMQMTLTQGVVERVRDALVGGVAPWERPPRLGFACGLPVNAVTGLSYRGVGGWVLELEAIDRGYRSPSWATRKEWQSLGLYPDESDVVVTVQPLVDQIKPYQDYIPLRLFNGDVVGDHRSPEKSPDYVEAQRIVDATGARVIRDHRCHYVWRGHFDYIGMIDEDKFLGGPDAYWSVMFHELVHWASLGKRRLDFQGPEDQYEFIADIGAAYLADHCGLVCHCPLRQEYTQAWVDRLDRDVNWLLEACCVAEQAVDLILRIGRNFHAK